MTLRMEYRKEHPEAFQAMIKLEKHVTESGIDRTLLELIKIRASQINGCAFCLNMHTNDARSQGETEQRIYLLSAWREAPYYTDAERAVLALTEAVTLISEAGVPQAVYDNVRVYYEAKQFVAILMAINTINCWNRLAIATGMMPS
ncbi:carboxymuconolactone decarboxylase family protein [Paenibacillus sp. SYP-B3998]|uniref:Carboxymuconolactone decarboxylase family protein n=1 Tax=Paenibacillus sp. SYP-B3998 TaxID=2678564 RepID=A0A6G3ZX18_9BACL|nr:carboxymuconolactone decarboxylase family protein [Paenibacillus sp. SYP-B3998]NEW06588.1 carboxymuconolactone decarboxylase family protein [Paenibacillus sp. SYP-B3998]